MLLLLTFVIGSCRSESRDVQNGGCPEVPLESSNALSSRFTRRDRPVNASSRTLPPIRHFAGAEEFRAEIRRDVTDLSIKPSKEVATTDVDVGASCNDHVVQLSRLSISGHLLKPFVNVSCAMHWHGNSSTVSHKLQTKLRFLDKSPTGSFRNRVPFRTTKWRNGKSIVANESCSCC